jgi:hypothetical protein
MTNNNNNNFNNFNNYKNKFTNFIHKSYLKIIESRTGKIIMSIIIFILIFDKATILLVTYIYSKYYLKVFEKKENYSNNGLETVIFEPSNNTIAALSSVFKHPELNLKSYTNIKLDPTKVMFEDNKFLPECCFYNSDYSSSKGCPCITGDQQNYLNARGTNKSYSSFIQDNNNYKNLYFSPTLAFQGDYIPFKTNDEQFIIDHEPLSVEKKNEFNSLINAY